MGKSYRDHKYQKCKAQMRNESRYYDPTLRTIANQRKKCVLCKGCCKKGSRNKKWRVKLTRQQRHKVKAAIANGREIPIFKTPWFD